MERSFHICHLTSVHTRFDIRIFYKQCISLSSAGYRVTLIVADGKGDEVRDNIFIRDVGCCSGGRFGRMSKIVWNVYKFAQEEAADLYHLHDAELLIAGLLLKRKKPVIYDVHEDLPRQILAKYYLPKILRSIIAKSIELFENISARKLSAICAATPHIRDRFKKFNLNCVDINNYPMLNELATPKNVHWKQKPRKVCYVGGITEIRGVRELISAFSDIEGKLDLAGRFSPMSIRKRFVELPGWEKVNELGFIDRQTVKKVLATSRAGIVTFHPEPNHINAQPNKLFEYLSAGIPVITSNFPLWRKIVGDYNCGILVDPLSSREISGAINWIFNHSKEAEELGKNGREAVKAFFNWENEKKKLMALYGDIIA